MDFKEQKKINDFNNQVNHGFVKGLTLQDQIHVSLGSITHNRIVIEDCIFQNGFTFGNGVSDTVEFEGKTTIKKLTYSKDNNGFLTIEDSVIDKVKSHLSVAEVYFSNSKISEVNEFITASSLNFNSKCKISYCQPSNFFKANNVEFDSITALSGGELENCNINTLVFSDRDGRIKIDQCSITNISFRNCSAYGKINETIIDNIHFMNFGERLNKHLTIINSSIKKRFSIKSSNLSYVKIFRVDLGDIECLVKEASLKAIELDSAKWPKYNFARILKRDESDLYYIEEIEAKKNSDKDDFLELRDFYRHLKIASINQHDKVNELKAYAFEMEAYYNSLGWGSSFWDKLNLCISKITNRFGLSWSRPILLYIVASMWMLLPICFIVDLERSIWIEYAIFLNPTRSIDFDIYNNFGAICLDFLTRIIQGLLVYQTISAFRKVSVLASTLIRSFLGFMRGPGFGEGDLIVCWLDNPG